MAAIEAGAILKGHGAGETPVGEQPIASPRGAAGGSDGDAAGMTGAGAAGRPGDDAARAAGTGAADIDRRGERRLLSAARRGDPAASERLVELHWDGAHRIAYGILGDTYAAEDVAQEALLSALAKLGRFDVYRPFAPWLHRIVTNRALDWHRARARRAEVTGTDLSAHLDAQARPATDPELEAALASLTPEQRAIVTLRYIGGYSPEEIAKALDIPRGTVGSRLRRALDRLREQMESQDGGQR